MTSTTISSRRESFLKQASYLAAAVVTSLPLAYAVFLAVKIFGLDATSEVSVEQLYEMVKVHIAAFFITVVMMAATVIFVARNRAMATKHQITWIILVALSPFLVMPAYWLCRGWWARKRNCGA